MISKYTILKYPLSRGCGAIHLIFTTPRFEVVSSFRSSRKLFSSTNPLRKSVIFQEPSGSENPQKFSSLTPAPPPPEMPVKTMSHAINKLPKKFLKHFLPFLRKDIACSHSPSKSETFTTPLRNFILSGVC